MGCGTSKHLGSTSPVITKTVSSDCNSAIINFNSSASGNIKDEIATIIKIHKGKPEDLKELYPKARDEWNRVLGNIKSCYSINFTASSLESPKIQSYSNWQSQFMEDYQRFFLLLTEYRYGDYPANLPNSIQFSSFYFTPVRKTGTSVDTSIALI